MATFLLEVGTEELPASFVSSALEQWRSQIEPSLQEKFLSPSAVKFYGTPRRLAVVIEGLPLQQSDREEDVKGPPAQAAFRDGQPTKAATGFAKSRGVSVEELAVRETDKGAFVFVQQKIPGRPTAEILSELVPQWIFGLEGKRFMRWGDGDLRFPRPIRWLVALLDQTLLAITLENGSEVCQSDRYSEGHRVLHPKPLMIEQAAGYRERLRSGYVEVDPDERRRQILQQVNAVVQAVSGQAVISESLLAEVTHLVEWPTAVLGKFDPEFLELPTAVITMEMESHQRYFPVRQQEDAPDLLPYFVTVSNGDPAKADIIAQGNGRVIRARLSDGKFFYDADRQIPLESYVPKLTAVTFEESLGSVRDKVTRLSAIAERIAEQSQLSPSDRSAVQRAALLCKADLVTQMVGEFPELQGVMGQKYALSSGESAAVATAIFEHYLPRGAQDQLPQTRVGQVVGIADRLDTLVGIFSLGKLPSGSSDPFALRRAANAIVNVTWAADLPLNLKALLQQVIADFAAEQTTVTDTAQLQAQLEDFFLQRIRTLLQEKGVDYDLVNAVLAEDDPAYTEQALADMRDVSDRARFLQTIRNDGTLADIYETVNRAARLAAQGTLDFTLLDPAAVIDPGLFQQPSEQAFFDSLLQLLPETQAAQTERNYRQLVAGLAKAAPVVSNFFDGPDSVLVMDENPDIQRNRLNLLGLLRNHARVLADFGAIIKS
ncbi:MAG: glycine--tRNA ligase subunit beta [Leptolyngbyaceae cyanobacterium RM1_1_2]|nr:glycine--tRNA ligase subunit beta [Leptolyngbyaceae cyanobacterium RM1_1_2]